MKGIEYNKSKQKNILIFLHIPKTAGTTLNDIIKYQYGKKNILVLNGTIEEKSEEFKKMSDSDSNKFQVIKGHMTFGVHNFLKYKSTYITVLRNPVNRIISVYYYLLQSREHPQHNLVKGKTLADFVLSNTAHNNGQTRFLAGKHNSDSKQLNDLLVRAKKNLKENFAVVGLVEKFDETLILLQRTLKWNKIPFYVKQNKSKRGNKESISRETLELIQARNELDMDLYKYAVALFEQQISSQDYSFYHDLQLFTFLNKVYHPIGGFYSFSRSIALKYKE